MGAAFFHHIRFFGLGELEEIEGPKYSYEESIASFIPNELGVQISGFLINKALGLWGHKDLRFALREKKSKNKPEPIENPFDVFKEMFSNNSVMKTVEIYSWFVIAESTGSGKSKQIRDLMKINYFDKKWTLPSRMEENPLVWMIQVNENHLAISN